MKREIFKNEKRLSQKLGNKYFFIFAGMTIFLFIIIILLQSFLTRYLIFKNENDTMLEELRKKKEKYDEFLDYQRIVTQNLAESKKLYQSGFLDYYRDSTNSITFFLKRENQTYEHLQLAWLNDLLEKLTLRSDQADQNLIVVDYPVVYSIYYTNIYNNYYKDVLISITPVNAKTLGGFNNFLVISKDQISDESIPGWIRQYYNKNLDNIIEGMQFRIFNVNNEESYYFSMIEDYQSHYQIFAYNRYYREVNLFFAKTFVLAGLLSFLSLILLIFAFGKWFSLEMIKPIVNLNEKMLMISRNPSARITLDMNTEGELQQIINVFNEMTASINAYQYSLTQYKLLFDQIQTGIFWLDKDLKIRLYNPEFIRIFELDEVPVLNSLITDITPLNVRIFNLNSNDIFSDLEMWLADLKKYVSVSLQCLDIDNQQVYICMIADITEQRILNEQRRSLEMELLKINRLAELGRRIQGIVHNLNSPLNSILGFAQLLEEENPGNYDVSRIIKSAVSMSQMIKTLLIKIKKDNVSFPDYVDLNEFLLLEIENCKHHLFFKNEVRLEIDLLPDLLAIFTIQGDLSQIFSILFNNAMDAMQESKIKNLKITSFKEKECIGFSVQDSGCGIPEANMEKIFEPNFTTKKVSFSGGYGLGLAIAKSIVQRLNGSVTVLSELHKGSTFTVLIPQNSGQEIIQEELNAGK